MFKTPLEVFQRIESKGCRAWRAKDGLIDYVRCSDGRSFTLSLDFDDTCVFAIDLKTQPFHRGSMITYTSDGTFDVFDAYFRNMEITWDHPPKGFLDIGRICRNRGWCVISPPFEGFNRERIRRAMFVKRTKDSETYLGAFIPVAGGWTLVGGKRVFGPDILKTEPEVEYACDQLIKTI